MAGVVHEVYAVKFGENRTVTRGRYFAGDAGRPADEPLPLDYFVWLVRSPLGDVVIDAGWTAATNRGRPRILFEEPGVALRRVGVDPGVVDTVILTHFHNDHVGDLDAFARATFVAQRAEYDFWATDAAWAEHATHVERDDVDRLGALHAAGRLRLLGDDTEVVDGVRVVRVGGHTPGSQVVVVDSACGPIVVAGDAVHYYEELERGAEFTVSTDADELRRAIVRIRELAGGGTVVPGHDPEVLTRFDPVVGHRGRAVRVA